MVRHGSVGRRSILVVAEIDAAVLKRPVVKFVVPR